MLSAVILAFSIALQVAAAAVALRLIRVTGRRLAWIALAAGLTLMAARRSITLYRLITGDLSRPPDLPAELVALVISALMLAGVLAIAPLFKAAHRARADLKDSEERFRDIVHAFGGHGWETDAENRFTYFSGQLVNAIPAAQLIGQRRWDLPGVFTEDADWEAYRADIAARRPIRDFRYRWHREDGPVEWVKVQGKPMFDGDGMYLGYRGSSADVTAEVEAEQRAATANERLAMAFEGLSEAFRLFDADDRLVIANPAWRKFNKAIAEQVKPGMSFEEILGLQMAAGLFPEAKGAEDAWIRERLERHRNPQRSFEVARQDGRWLLVNEQRMPDGGIFSIAADVTEIKEAQQALRASEGHLKSLAAELERRVEERTEALTRELKERERVEAALRASEESLRAVMDTTIDGIIVIDETGIIESFNSSAAKIFGYTADEVIGHNVRMLMPEPDRGRHDGYVETYLSTGDAKIIGIGREVVGRRKDGSEFPLDLGISEANLGDRRVFTGIVRDITERHQAREALEESEERLHRAVRDAPFSVIMHAEDGEMLLVNKRWTELTGYTLDDIPTIDAWTTKAFAPKREELREFIKSLYGLTEPLHQGEFEITTASGEKRIWDFRTSPLGRLSDGRRFVISMATDVTERNRAARELLAAKEEADAASHAKSEFLSRMSHELRTPMNAILGFAQLLEADPDEPLTDAQAPSVKQILKSGEHLLELINEVLDLVTVETGKVALTIESLDVPDIVQSCLEITQTLADKRAIDLVDRSSSRAPPRVLADPTRFRQVLLNLLSNAVKYNREGGSVTIDCGETEEGMMRVSVTDTGAGIPDDKRDDLFRPFTRFNLDRQEIEGTGIGLTISKQLVELMDGRIGYESRPGQGSTFWLELPTDQSGAPPTEAGEPQARSAPETLAGIAKVLYVEDDPANIRLMEQIMRRFAGITLISAHNASLALALVESARPDVIVLDINLPGMNGIEALDRLQREEATRDIPVIALSANALPGDIKRGLEVGFRHYLTKPINIPKFLDALRECAPATETT
jgi:PAS domain S-box-containing protein